MLASEKASHSETFPKLAVVAARLLSLATQSADVERCCKVHKIVHTKARNRLRNSTVQMLVFCYVNLRLMKQVEGDDVTLDSKNDLEDFLGSAIDSSIEASPGTD